MHPAAKWTLLILGGLIGLLLLIFAGAVLWLNTGSGRDFVLNQAQSAVPGLTIENASGGVFDLAAERLSMADAEGVWLRVEDLRLDWSPWALLSRTLAVDLLAAERVEVVRAPVPEPEPAPGDTQPFQLPLTAELERLDLARVELGETLLNGITAVVAAQGSARLPAGELGGSADIAVQRIDDQPGSLALEATYVPNRRLTLDLRAEEPANGVIAGLLEIPDRPPVTVTLTGDGPLTDWTGNLTARAGDVASAEAEARIRPAGGVYSFGLDAAGDIAALLPQPWAGLVGERLRVAAGGIVHPGRRVALDGASIEGAFGNIAGQGVYSMDEDRVNFGFYGAVPEDSPVHAAVPEPTFRTAQIQGKAVGPLTAPVVTATVQMLEPAYQAYAADRLTVTANLDPQESFDRFALNADVIAEGLLSADPQFGPIAGPRTELSVTGLVETPTGRVDLSRIAVDAGAVDAVGTAALQGWGEAATAHLSLSADDLSALSALAGQDLGGALQAELDVERPSGGDITARLKAALDQPSTGIPAANALLGRKAEVAATIVAGDATRLPTFRIATERATLEGEATLADNLLTAAVKAAVRELGPLGDAVGTPMSGSAAAELRAKGPLDSVTTEGTVRLQDFILDGRNFGQAVANLNVAGLPAAPEGTVALETALAGEPVKLNSRFALSDQRLRVPELAASIGPNSITGELTAQLSPLSATGALTAEMPQLATIGALLGERLSGSASAAIRLDGAEGGQTVAVDAQLNDLVRRTPDAVQRIGAVTLDATVRNALAEPVLDVALNGQELTASGARIETLSATLEGPLETAEVTLALDGRAGADMDLRAAGQLGLGGEATEIALTQLQGSYDGQEFRIADRAVLAAAGEGFRVSGLELLAGDARLTADADLTGGDLSADISLAGVPLQWLRAVDPTLDLGGTVEGDLSLAGTVAQPRGRIDLAIADLRTSPEREENIISALDADLDGVWENGRLELTFVTEAAKAGIDLRAEASLPLVLAGGPLAFELPPDGAIRADLDGTLELGLLNDVLAATGDRVGGRATVDLSATGTVADQVFAGTVAVADGLYENQQLGTSIRNITARLVGNADGLVLEELRGTTPNDGAVRADGVIRFDPAWGDQQIELSAVAERARVAQTDMITADADAELTLRGSFDEAMLSGAVEIRQAYVTIPDELPASVVDLEVTEINRPGDAAETASARVPDAKPAPPAGPETVSLAGPDAQDGLDVGLKIDVEAPNEIYVRGRGLDAEFQADLDILGTAEAPIVDGTVTLLKGELSVLGQTLDLTRGVLTFPGDGSLDPQLDIEAQTTRGDVTAIIEVSGTASAPKLGLTSEPPLPEDEVLAQLLFGQDIGELSALEALQLAQGAAQLTGVLGTGPGVLDTVKRGIGVDRLEFRGSETGEGLGSVAAGRYIGDRVYLGVEQDLGSGQSKATVEYDINESIRLEGEVGRQSKVGVQFEWDY